LKEKLELLSKVTRINAEEDEGESEE